MTNPCRLFTLVLSTAMATACGSDSDGPSAPPAADLGRWSAPVVIGDGGPGWIGSRFTSGGGTVTGLVLDADGRAAVSFAVAGTPGDPLAATWQAAASTSAAAASWTPPVSLGPTGEFRSWPRDLASDGNGGAAVVGDAGGHLYEARFAQGELASRRRHRDGPRRFRGRRPSFERRSRRGDSRCGSRSASGPPSERPVEPGCRELRSATARKLSWWHTGARPRPFGPAAGDHRSHGRRRRALGARASARRDRRRSSAWATPGGRRRVSGHLDGVDQAETQADIVDRPVRFRKRLATGDRPDRHVQLAGAPASPAAEGTPLPIGSRRTEAARDSTDSGGVGKGTAAYWSSPCRCEPIHATGWRPRRQSMRRA